MIKRHNTVSFGVIHPVGKYCCAPFDACRISNGIQEAMTVKDIITKDQAGGIIGNEFFCNNKCLGQTLRLRLFRIIEGKPDLFAIAQ